MSVAAAGLAGPRESSSALRRAASSTWHVSPAIDLAGYAFSWVLLAVPLYLVLGADMLRLDEARASGFAFVAGAIVLIDVHRHFTFPYVYLDRQRRQAFPVRFWLLPAVCLALLSQLPFLAVNFKLLYPAECAAIVAWVVVLVQVLRADAVRAASKSAVTGVAIALAAGALLAWGVRVPSGWAWLLSAAGASLWIARAVSSVRAASAAGWIAPAGMAALILIAATTRLVLPVRSFVNALVTIYLVWLIYHVLSQKYGILRIYAAKAGSAALVPRWVDRSVVWGWIPLVIVASFIQTPEAVVQHLLRTEPSTRLFLDPLVPLILARPGLWLAAGAAPVVAALGAFLCFEWKVHRMRNVPRLAFAAGTGILFASTFLIGAVGLYVAFAATHCIEYLTFLWAHQRQRYPGYDAQAPILSRLIQWPIVYYGGIVASVAAISFLARYAAHYFPASASSLFLFGHPLYTWAFWYSIMQAFLHFYYDGFLWKMKPELVRSL